MPRVYRNARVGPRCCHRQTGTRLKGHENDNETQLTLHRGVVAASSRANACGPGSHAGINQKYEMRPAEFRYIYGGGQFNDTHSRSRVIVNISIRSIPTTHAYADKPCNQRCFMRVQGAFDNAMRRASCCHLFAHYITLLPSRVSPANLHYKCRWCYHRFAYTLWRRWRIVNGGRTIVHVYVSAYDAALRDASASRGTHSARPFPALSMIITRESELAGDNNRARFAPIELLTTVRQRARYHVPMRK